ncbi:MAG TPA: cytochrome P460 family protein [Phototrophicaceae bacterium]|nr:cytochrome P460 family protein [Phototrophicaceae bacterium]
MKPSVFFTLLALALLGLVVYSGVTRPPAGAFTRPTTVAQLMPTVPPIYLTGQPTTQAMTASVGAPATMPPRTAPMSLPADYRQNYILYAIVDRSDNVTRKLYTSQDAINAVRAGLSFPDGTQFIVEAYDATLDTKGQPLRDAQGHLVAGAFQPEVHTSQMRSDWQPADLIPGAHTGEFNFDAFDFNTGVENPSERATCFNCHSSALATGFVYSLALIRQYAFTGQTQYMYCDLPGRLACTN